MIKIKTLFVNPPIRLDQPPHHIPYGLALLYKVLENKGYDVALYDQNIHRQPRAVMRSDIKLDEHEGKWDMIGLGGLITTYKWQKETIPFIREDNPDATIIAGGFCFSSFPKEYMEWNPDVDIGVIGEGEITIDELTDALEGKRTLKSVDGIIYREDGELVFTKKRKLIEDLDTLPYPAFEACELERYFQFSPIPLSAQCLQSRRRIDLITQRGCPKRCTFCYHGGMGHKPRFQSAEYVVGLMEHVRKHYCVDFISFLDENMLLDRDRIMKLCDLIEERELIGLIKWGCAASVDTVDIDLLTRIRDCGCTYISYGGESASQARLDDIRKGQTAKQMEIAISMTKSAKIQPQMTFMVGYPDETIDDYIETTRFFIDNGIITRPFFIHPYPRTALFAKIKDKIIDYEKWLLSLGDATKLTANLSPFSDPVLLGLRELMASHDIERLEHYKKHHKKQPKAKKPKMKMRRHPKR